MMARADVLRLGLAAGLAVTAAQVGTTFAAMPTTIDTPPIGIAGPTIEIAPAERLPRAAAPPSGNPLWAIPLSMLSATRERPIFLPSRRPPAPIMASPRAAPASALPAPAPEPTRPPLALVGAVVGETEAIAIFVDQTTRNVVRLKTGQGHAGWVLSSVKGREATLQKDQLTAVFVLPVPSASGPASTAANPAVSGVASDGGEPFVPRSTPKNGESDGL